MVVTVFRVGVGHAEGGRRCNMPILVMGAMALAVFGVIGILLYTASSLERHNKKTRL
jgi:hypothetical protein